MKAVILALAVALVAATPAPTNPRQVIISNQIELPLSVLVDRYYHVFSLQNPTGSYAGSKTILGQNIDASLTIESDSTIKFTISGAISVDCDGEAYSYNAPNLEFPNAGKSGDCLHDALEANGVSLVSTVYDSTSDTVTSKVKFGILSIALTLNKVKSVPVFPTQVYVLPMSELYSRYFKVFMEGRPDGEYVGTKSILGQQVVSTISVDSDSVFNFTVAGPVSIDCTNEAYKFSSDGSISLPNIDTAGDCLHDTLATQHVSLTSFSFDQAANEIHITVKYSFISITLDLAHKA